ncbi:MAG: hypothetical protein ACT4P7_20855 [Gemmatimonadaceae bacterium]
MCRSSFVALTVGFTLAAFPAAAQRGYPPPFEGPRGFYTFDLSDGEPISFFLEVSREVGLRDDQKARLMEIRRRLRVQNGPHMVQLDSLRALAGIDLGDRNGINQRDSDALRRFNEWARPVIDSIRLNNDVARAEARTLLDGDQRSRLDSIARLDRAVVRRARRERPPADVRFDHELPTTIGA